MQLVRDFIANGDKVVVIEVNENNEYHKTAESLGAIVIFGNSTEKDVLKKTKVQYASHVVVTEGQDKTNLKTAIQIYEIVRETRGFKSTSGFTEKPVNCKVHLTNAGFLGLIGNHEIFTETNDYFDLSFFNTNLYASRILFFDNPIESIGDTISENASPLHLLIYGMTEVGMGVGLQAVKLGHFVNGKKLPLTFLGENHEEKERIFQTEYPQFDKVADYEFFNIQSERSFNEDKIKIGENYEFPLTAIIVCNGTDEDNLTDSLTFARIINKNENAVEILIFIHMKDNLGLSSFYSIINTLLKVKPSPLFPLEIQKE